MRIHIVGGSGSGKTYISDKLKTDYNLDQIDLDEIEWVNNNGKMVKRELEVKRKLLKEKLKKDNIILEGVYYDWCIESFNKCDYIFYLKAPLITQEFRIIKRSIKRKLGIEESFFKETFKTVYDLLTWNIKYNKVFKKEIMEILDKYNGKVYNVNSYKEIKKVLEEKK